MRVSLESLTKMSGNAMRLRTLYPTNRNYAQPLAKNSHRICRLHLIMPHLLKDFHCRSTINDHVKALTAASYRRLRRPRTSNSAPWLDPSMVVAIQHLQVRHMINSGEDPQHTAKRRASDARAACSTWLLRRESLTLATITETDAFDIFR